MSEMKETKEILKSSNPKNPNVDNMKQGWEIKKLGEFCEFINGLWTGKKPPFQTVGVIRNTNFSKDCQLDYSDIVYLEVEQSQFQKRKLQYGDIILEKSGGGPKQPVGRVVIFNKVEGDFSFSNFTSVIRIKNKDDVDFNFLHRYLFFEYISGATEKMQSHSTGIRNLKFDDYKDIEIPLPPLPEQQHIVSILDECFAAIDKAKANAKKNLKNAKELFEVFLHKYFTNKEEGWEEKKLKDVAEYFNGLTYSPKDVSNKGIIVLRSSNIQNDKLDFSDIVRVNVSVKDKIIVKDGDILMCSRNGSKRLVGKTAPIENLPEQMTFGTFMMIVRSSYNPYLLWFFKSLDFKKQISGGENTMINQITRYMLDDIVVSFPPIEKQMEIVNQLNAIYIESQKLESIYQQKIADLEELKKSILQKAFAGELKMSEPLINAD
jgi:type I restriction enzyme S subunit